MATIHRTVSIGSISSITSEGSITGKKKTKPTSVTCGFKYNWFESTLNFVKDDRRMSLKYGVTPAQAIFIRDTLNFEVNPSLRLEKYAPLYEALKIFGLKFKFKLSRINKDIIILQKIPKPHQQFVEPNSKSEILSPQMEREKKVIDRISREYMVEKSQTILDFIDDPTRATLEFTNVTPLESNFLQTVMTAARPMFPEHAQMLEYMRKLKPTLDFSLQVVVGKINKKNNQRSVTFKKDPKFRKKGKRDRENSLNRQSISLNNNFAPSTKEQPKISQNNAHNKENSTQKQNSMEIEQNKTNSMQTEVESTLSYPNSVQNVQNTAQNAQTAMQVQNSVQNVQDSVQNVQDSVQTAQKSMQVEPNSQEPMDVDSPRSIGSGNSCSAISVQSEPVRGVDKAHSASVGGSRKPLGNFKYGSQNDLNFPSLTTNNTECLSRRNVSCLKPSKAKLLEDLSMPVLLDKPTRMMEKMGWRGGPLGIRGNGITEPIMPALHLVSRVGFGHVQKVSETGSGHVEQVSDARFEHVEPVKRKQKRDNKDNTKVGNRKNFQREILETILDLVESERVTVNVVYKHMISRKEINFVRHVVTSFSERQQINLPNKEEARVAQLVMDALHNHPNVVVHGTASECKKKITLKKVIIVTEGDLPLLPQTKIIKVKDLIGLAELLEGQRYISSSSKLKKYIGTKITMLIEILHFVQFSEESRELFFEASLTKRETNYITKTVDNLSKRNKPPLYHTMNIEDDIYNEILSVIGNNMFTVKFDKNKPSVILDKVQMKPHNNAVTNKLHPVNGNNNNAVQNINIINGKRPNESAISYMVKRIVLNKVETAKNNIDDVNKSNSIVSVQNDVNNSKLSNKTIAGNKESLFHGRKAVHLRSNVNLNDTNDRNDANNMNKILEKRLNEPIKTDEPKTDEDRNGDDDDSLKNNDRKSNDDDVIIIETVHEIIVISDDESGDTNTENTQNTDRSVKIDEVLEKQGLEVKISNFIENVDVSKVSADFLETQKDTDSNITQCRESADMGISNSQGSGEVNMMGGSADRTLPNSQYCTTALDESNIQEITPTDITKGHLNISTSNSQNNTACDISKITENVQIDKTKDSANKSPFNIEKQDNTPLDMSIIQENAKVASVKGVNISISSIDNSTLERPNIDILDGEKTENTDNNKVIVKINPKKEKLSYSEEFDKDLYDLEQVLLLVDDDDVFDYTIVKKEKEDSIDKIERPSSKRSRSDSVESSPDNSKKTKVFTFKNSKNLLIVHKDYPDVEITKECTIKIQTILSDAIDKCKELPLLKCHGIKDGGLVYSCHSEQSLFFVENSLSVASDYKIISDVPIKNHKPYVMKIRFNSLLDNMKTLFSRLELYNAGLITDCWYVKKTQKCDDYLVVFVEIDDYSYEYICDNRFCLYAGIDEARFSVVWD